MAAIVEKKVKGALSHEEVRYVARACNAAREKACVMLILDFGARASKPVTWNVGDIDLDTGALTLPVGKVKRSAITRRRNQLRIGG